MPDASEFFLRFREEAGGYVATCQQIVRFDYQGPQLLRLDIATDGHGATALAACVNALMNSQVQDMTGTQVA